MQEIRHNVLRGDDDFAISVPGVGRFRVNVLSREFNKCGITNSQF